MPPVGGALLPAAEVASVFVAPARLRLCLAKMVKPPLYFKEYKFLLASWRAQLVPATLEAESGELLGPRRQRLQ